MTVQELIDKLNKVEDKSKKVIHWDESNIYEVKDYYEDIMLD